MNETNDLLLTMILAAQIEQIAHRDWASQPFTGQRKAYSDCETEAFNRIVEISKKVRKATSLPPA